MNRYTTTMELIIFLPGALCLTETLLKREDGPSTLRDRSKITSHNLFAKVLKTLDILQTECELIREPTLSWNV